MSSLEPLIVLCQKIVADRDLTEIEARELAAWLRDHPDLRELWPGSVLNDRLNEILADGVVTEAELINLALVLDHISELDPRGEGLVPDTVGLPVDHPAPAVEFSGRRFSFLGEFVLGSAHACAAATRKLGGITDSTFTAETDYLVLGAVEPEALLEGDEESTLGRALELKSSSEGRPAIITEQHWADAFDAATGELSATATVSPAIPSLPVLRRRMRLHHEVSGGQQDVDLAVHSCTCGDWKTRRESLPENDLGRCCPHVARALADVNAATTGPAWLGALLTHLRKGDRGLNPADRFIEVNVGGQAVLAIVSADWIQVYGPTPAGPYERYSFHRSEKRWAYRLMPVHGNALSALFSEHPKFG